VGFISNAANSPTVEAVTGTGVAQTAYSVNLSWDSGSGNAVGYNVYRGTVQTGPFQKINSTLDASTNYTDSTVVSGATYYYVTTEVNAQGQESSYSNEVEAAIPNFVAVEARRKCTLANDRIDRCGTLAEYAASLVYNLSQGFSLNKCKFLPSSCFLSAAKSLISSCRPVRSPSQCFSSSSPSACFPGR